MTTMEQPTCQTCRHFVAKPTGDKDGDGECHRNPPTPHVLTQEVVREEPVRDDRGITVIGKKQLVREQRVVGVIGFHSPVRPVGFCGEHTPRREDMS